MKVHLSSPCPPTHFGHGHPCDPAMAGLKSQAERAREIREAVTQLRHLHLYDATRFPVIKQFNHIAYAYIHEAVPASGSLPFEELDTRLVYRLPLTVGRPAVVKLSKTGQ